MQRVKKKVILYRQNPIKLDSRCLPWLRPVQVKRNTFNCVRQQRSVHRPLLRRQHTYRNARRLPEAEGVTNQKDIWSSCFMFA